MPVDPLTTSLAPGQRLELEGTRNTRDIGGYRTVDGATVRRGVVFRSDGLDHLTDADTDLLLGAGVRAILDFRSAAEASRPGPMTERLGAAGVARRNLPLFDEADARSLFQTPLEPGVHPLEPYYRSILVRHAANVRTALELLAEPANRPAIVHCSAGKDRTGVIVALLLSLAGVPASTICEDYARTGEYLDSAWIESRRDDAVRWGIPWDRYVLAYESPPGVMAATLRFVAREFPAVGSSAPSEVSGYLASIGVTEGTAAALRGALRAPFPQ